MKTIRFILILVLCLASLTFVVKRANLFYQKGEEPLRLVYLKQQVLDFARKYQDKDAIVVSKQDHLLHSPYWKKIAPLLVPQLP